MKEKGSKSKILLTVVLLITCIVPIRAEASGITCTGGSQQHDFGAYTVEKTVTEDGEIKLLRRVCSKCGHVETAQFDHPQTNQEHTHVYDMEVEDEEYLAVSGDCRTKTIYYKSCLCGECGNAETFEGSVADHVFGDYIVIKEATATEKGKKQRTCSVCQYVETAELDVTDPDVVGTAETDVKKDSQGKAERIRTILMVLSGAGFVIMTGVIVLRTVRSKKSKS